MILDSEQDFCLFKGNIVSLLLISPPVYSIVKKKSFLHSIENTLQGLTELNFSQLNCIYLVHLSFLVLVFDHVTMLWLYCCIEYSNHQIRQKILNNILAKWTAVIKNRMNYHLTSYSDFTGRRKNLRLKI